MDHDGAIVMLVVAQFLVLLIWFTPLVVTARLQRVTLWKAFALLVPVFGAFVFRVLVTESAEKRFVEGVR